MRSKRWLIAAVCSILLTSACGSSGSDPAGSQQVESGPPVAGGVGRVVQVREPLTMDPAGLINMWIAQGFLGNALYGSLMTIDPDTVEVEYSMATDFSTADGGNTFTLTLQPGLTFTDGTPLDAEAVKFNWDRLRDPATKSPTITQAVQVAATEVLDATKLRVSMVSPAPNYALSLIPTAMNWIASPSALRQGQEKFDEAPVGAGPFSMEKWARQDVIELRRNPNFWDSPKPYLDAVTLRTVADSNQRRNIIMTDGADLVSESSWSVLATAEQAGIDTQTVPLSGGQYFAMNTRRAPFDDIRARRAVALALDLDSMNISITENKGVVPRSLFDESSPFGSDIPFVKSDPEEAQRLFDELAAEGNPVKFKFTATTLVDVKMAAESVQAQLSTFDNVEVAVEALDYATVAGQTTARDFDMLVSSALVQDPDSTLWNAFHPDSRGNLTGINDQALGEALDIGRTSEVPEERKAAYETVQARLAELIPGVWYVNAVPSIMLGENMRGGHMYGLGSPVPEDLWLAD